MTARMLKRILTIGNSQFHRVCETLSGRFLELALWWLRLFDGNLLRTVDLSKN